MSVPPHHFPNDPPFDMDFDPETAGMASDWSAVDAGVVDVGTETQTALRATRKSAAKKSMAVSEDDDSEDETDESGGGESVVDPSVIDELSLDYIISWNRLVSMTNWEKGKLIFNWRTRLAENNLPRQTYSDETLAKRLGNVSGQHVGRLRRVFERFGENFERYDRLYWSHFQAVLDWDDAETWLDDASENQWSVATMRLKRWESIGAPAGQKPRDSEIVASEMDEDVNPYNDSDTILDGQVRNVAGNSDKTKEKKKKHSENDDSEGSDSGGNFRSGGGDSHDDLSGFSSASDAFAQMKKLKDLPEDLQEAFEQLKTVILSHKVSGWREVEPQRILTFLNAMKVVVMTEEK
ncbi:MAG: hypothetical protein FWC50_08770 [Planctomycetaceae bacterium]|nr:hypothetical protein [Planctomycetaceae bacterium]